MKVLLFAGTSEGRILAERLAEMPLHLTVSVATEYGREMIRGLPDSVTIITGRMDEAAIAELLRSGMFSRVVDATHPYAIEASRNIRAASAEAEVPLLRLLRDKSADGNFVCVGSAAEAADWLAKTRGNVLLATGSKELATFTSVPDFAARLFPRLLPASEAIGECERLGFLRSHIIAMQGPFGTEMNLALMRHFAIAILVTKDGGAAGGFPEKIRAAEEAGVRVVVIGRPVEETGLGMNEVTAAIAADLKTEER